MFRPGIVSKLKSRQLLQGHWEEASKVKKATRSVRFSWVQRAEKFHFCGKLITNSVVRFSNVFGYHPMMAQLRFPL